MFCKSTVDTQEIKVKGIQYIDVCRSKESSFSRFPGAYHAERGTVSNACLLKTVCLCSSYEAFHVSYIVSVIYKRLLTSPDKTVHVITRKRKSSNIKIR